MLYAIQGAMGDFLNMGSRSTQLSSAEVLLASAVDMITDAATILIDRVAGSGDAAQGAYHPVERHLWRELQRTKNEQITLM